MTFSTEGVKTLIWRRGFIYLFKITFSMFIFPIPEDSNVTRSSQSLLVLFDIKLVFMRGTFLAEAFCEICVRKRTRPLDIDPQFYVDNQAKLLSLAFSQMLSAGELSLIKNAIIRCWCYRNKWYSIHLYSSRECGMMPYPIICQIISMASNKTKMDHLCQLLFPLPVCPRRFSAAQDFSISFRSCTCKEL